MEKTNSNKISLITTVEQNYKEELRRNWIELDMNEVSMPLLTLKVMKKVGSSGRYQKSILINAALTLFGLGVSIYSVNYLILSPDPYKM